MLRRKYWINREISYNKRYTSVQGRIKQLRAYENKEILLQYWENTFSRIEITLDQ